MFMCALYVRGRLLSQVTLERMGNLQLELGAWSLSDLDWLLLFGMELKTAGVSATDVLFAYCT